jgi:predicted nucleotidyltransferase
MIAVLENKREEISQLCKQFGIRRLEVFGSAVTGAFDPETSDLDFLVDLGGYEQRVAKRYLRFAEALEQLLGYDVDLVTEDSITNPYFRRSVGQSRELIYGTRDREAVA